MEYKAEYQGYLDHTTPLEIEQTSMKGLKKILEHGDALMYMSPDTEVIITLAPCSCDKLEGLHYHLTGLLQKQEIYFMHPSAVAVLGFLPLDFSPFRIMSEADLDNWIEDVEEAAIQMMITIMDKTSLN